MPGHPLAVLPVMLVWRNRVRWLIPAGMFRLCFPRGGELPFSAGNPVHGVEVFIDFATLAGPWRLYGAKSGASMRACPEPILLQLDVQRRARKLGASDRPTSSNAPRTRSCMTISPI